MCLSEGGGYEKDSLDFRRYLKKRFSAIDIKHLCSKNQTGRNHERLFSAFSAPKTHFFDLFDYNILKSARNLENRLVHTDMGFWCVGSRLEWRALSAERCSHRPVGVTNPYCSFNFSSSIYLPKGVLNVRRLEDKSKSSVQQNLARPKKRPSLPKWTHGRKKKRIFIKPGFSTLKLACSAFSAKKKAAEAQPIV